jgi:hypothetical protein
VIGKLGVNPANLQFSKPNNGDESGVTSNVIKTISPCIEVESSFDESDSIFDRRNRNDIVHRSGFSSASGDG